MLLLVELFVENRLILLDELLQGKTLQCRADDAWCELLCGDE
jgi:hypothetical protein